MLSISKPLSAGRAQYYHAKEFISPEQSYWSRGQTVQGEWQGRLAEKLELAGAVAAEKFALLSEGRHPVTGDQLVRHLQSHEYQTANGKTVKSSEHRAGWDATFSAPKSVSLTALVGGDDRVRAAHREAVYAALTELERFTQARNNPTETTGQFVAAKFEHDTARPVDGYAAPQLHTHAVIFNMTHCADSASRALEARSLFESQQFVTAVYQSELMYQLRNLGYEIQFGKSGAPEIKGYSQEYLEASSPRSQQIRAFLERSGLEGPAAAKIAALSTRDRKQILSPAEVFAAHRKLAAEFGNQDDRVVAAAHALALQAHEPDHFQQMQLHAYEAVTWARDKIFEREDVGDERAIFRDALRRGMGDVRYTEIRANFEARMQAGEFREVEVRKHASGRLFTTQTVLRAERDVLRSMHDGQNQVEPIMPVDQAIAHTDGYPLLNSAQRRAIEEILVSRDRVQGLQGYAGVGMTAALLAVRQAAERNGHVVEGFAPTSRAARQLREAGISADTLQGFLARGGQQRAGDSNSRHLYMVDESSLAGTRQMREFLTRIDPEDQVLLIGDLRQHQGVEAGKPFEQLVEAGMRTAKLDEIIRQKDPALKSVVVLLARGQPAAALDLLQQQNRVREIPDPQECIRAIARVYAECPASTLIVSPDNASRRELNMAVREELKARGDVAAENRSFRVLVQRQEMTGADRAWANHYETGDVVRYARGSKSIGIEACTYGTVVAISPKANLLSVELRTGGFATYDPRRLTGVNVYREVPYEFSVGDRIQFTASDKSLGVANRDFAVIESITSDGRIVAWLDGGRQIEFQTSEHRHFDHGYAVTSYSSQGLTAERVLIHADTAVHPDLLNSHFGYVSVSRASHQAMLFTNDATRLGLQLGAEISKTSPVEIVQSAAIGQGLGMT